MKNHLFIRLAGLRQGENLLEYELSARELGLGDRVVTENPSFESLVGPVRVSLTAVRTGQQLLLSGRVVFRARLACALCGGVYEQDFDEPLSAEFASCETDHPGHGIDAEEIECQPVTTDEIELVPIIRDAIHLAVPIAPACRPDCKGLCGICGANLNLSSCECAGAEPPAVH